MALIGSGHPGGGVLSRVRSWARPFVLIAGFMLGTSLAGHAQAAVFTETFAAKPANLPTAPAPGTTSFTMPLGGQDFTFLMSGGDLSWDDASYPGNPALNVNSFAPATLTVRRSDNVDFILSSLVLDVVDAGAGGQTASVQAYRDGIAQGSAQAVSPGNRQTLSFGGLRVDEVRITSGEFVFTLIDDIAGNSVVPDTTPPTVDTVTSFIPDGTYKVGDIVPVQVTFTENVTVIGTPRLTLETGSTDRVVNYSAGSGSSVLTFDYTVQTGDSASDLDYASTTALVATGASIRDAAGNDAVLTLASPGTAGSLGANRNLAVDGVVPTVTSVSSSTANGTYRIGEVITVLVNFSEPVIVAGSPQLTLETGSTDRTIGYASGSGTSALSFAYTVLSGESSADLDYASTNALALNGGTLRDAAGNNAVLTLASPGAANSLGANKALAIDGVMPAVQSIVVTGTPASTAPSMAFTVTFTEPVSNVSTDDFTLVATGTASGSIASVSASSGTGIDVTVSGITGDGTLKLNLNGSTNIADVAGNASPANFSAGAAHTVVTPRAPGAPTGASASAGNTQATVSFVAPVDGGSSPITQYTVTSSPGSVTASGTASPLTVTGLTNGTAYTFTVTATNADGTSVASGATVSVTPKAPQTITFANPGAQNFGTTPTLTATSNAGLTVAFTSSTTGVCTITSGGVLTFVTAGTCTIGADQPGNATTFAATTVSRSFTVNAVVPGAPTIGTATPGDSQALVTFTAPASTGGAFVNAYTVTAHPDGNTATGAGSPIVVAGLTNGVSYTFTVTATNGVGTGAASSASNAVIPRAMQTITFANPGAQNFGTTPTLTATSDAGLTPVFTSSTGSVCTITSAGQLTFLAAGTCTINADEPGNASYLPATQVSRSFVVNAVLPGAPRNVAASPSDPTSVSVAFDAPVSHGGSTISSYTVTASPGSATVSGASSPLLVTGLTTGTVYTFTVTATNNAGTGAPSAASNGAAPLPLLTAAASNASVTYGAGATPIPLSISGTPTSVAVSSAATHGTVVATGTTITYQPVPGYAGTDSFSYTASDAYTTTAPATVTVTIANATVTVNAAPLPNATGGVAYAHTFTAGGGLAPYTYSVVSGALPAGITLAADGTLSGAPTVAGTFNLRIHAIDSSSGTGPFADEEQFTLIVDAPAIAFAQATLPSATHGVSYDQTVTVTGGTAPYTYSTVSGTLPRGVALSAAGVFSGTALDAGRYPLTLEARDAHGFVATQAFELVVSQATQAITGFASNPSAPVYAPDGRFALIATGGASGNPVVFASTTPSVCQVSGANATILAMGRCSLTADQAGDANHQAAPQVRLDVDIAAAVPVLTWTGELHKVLGEPSFDLANPGSPSPGGFTFTSDRPDVAGVQGRTVTLVGAGMAVITATQAAAGNYTAASVQLRLVVDGRPDPTRDPGVVSSLQAQVDASVRFASAQRANIGGRLRQVRDGGNASSNQLSLNYGAGRQSLSLPLGQAIDGAAPALPAGWGTWAAGAATFGNGGNAGGYAFRTDGITVGVDRAFGESVLLGAAGSFATDDSDLDGSPSQVRSDQQSLAVYGLWRAGEHLFVDGLLAAGRLDFDLERWSDVAGATATGSRGGDQRFGSVTLGYEHRDAGMTLTGYGRFDASRTTLDAYREHGLDIYDLAYRRQDIENSTLALGMEGSYQTAGRARPFWSAEYREALENNGAAAINYVVWPNPTDYRLGMRSFNDHALSVSAGVDVQLQRGWMLSLLFGHEQARDSNRSNSFGLRVTYGAQASAATTATTVGEAATAADASSRCGRAVCDRSRTAPREDAR